MVVRVLRVMEYTYETVERATADMSRWVVQGEYRPSFDMKIVSRSFPLEVDSDATFDPGRIFDKNMEEFADDL